MRTTRSSTRQTTLTAGLPQRKTAAASIAEKRKTSISKGQGVTPSKAKATLKDKAKLQAKENSKQKQAEIACRDPPSRDNTTGYWKEMDDPELILAQFDVDTKFGPTLGMTRLERWERAERFGLEPPTVVKELLLAGESDKKSTASIWEQ